MNNLQPDTKQEEVKQQAEVAANSSQVKVDTTIAQTEPEGEKEINWKKFKEARAKERIEAELMSKKAQEKEAEAAALKAALEAVVNRPNHQNVNQSEQFEDLTEEERIDKKVQAALEKAERKREEEYARRENELLPQRLNKNNPDFSQVCSQENLDYLDYHYPEISRAFQKLPDNYEKWEDVYKAIKRFVPNTNSTKESNKAVSNLTKPQSISSPGVTQTGNQTNPTPFLSEERKRANWERMQKTRNSIE